MNASKNSRQALTFLKSEQIKDGGQVISLTLTPSYVFIATKNRDIQRLNSKLQNASDSRSTSPSYFDNETIQRIGHLKFNQKIILIMLTNSRVYAQTQENFAKSKAQLIIDKYYKYFTVIPYSPYAVFYDNQTLALYSITHSNDRIIVQRIFEKQHQMKGALDVVANSETILLYDKRNYKIFNKKLEEICTEPIQRPFKCVAPVDDNSGMSPIHTFFAVQDNVLIQLKDKLNSISKLSLNEIKFPEEILSLQVRLPYIYALSQKNLMYYLTVAPVKDNIIPLDFKAKNPILSIYDDYSVILSNDSKLYYIKFDQDVDIKYLKDENQWDKAKYIYMQMGRPLEELYCSMTDYYFSTRSYDDAFSAFKQSGRHPFEIISKFSFSNENLKKTAKNDLEKYKNLLTNLCDLLSKNPPAPDNEINKALEELYNQSKSKYLNNEFAKHQLNIETIDQCLNNAKNIEEQIPKLHSDSLTASKKLDNESSAYQLLIDYIEDLVKVEIQPTAIKIYNTILAETYHLKGAAESLRRFIQDGHPLFFDIVSSALQKKNKSTESLLLLCEQYKAHDIALNIAKEDSIESFIRYVSCSQDCIKLAPYNIKYVFDWYKKMHYSESECARKAAELFFSKNLVTAVDNSQYSDDYYDKTDIDKICDIIDCSKDIGRTQSFMKMAFLEYVVKSLKVNSPNIHAQLVNLYIENLRSNFKFREGRKYIEIDEESDPEVKKVRKSLLNFLKISDYYEPQDVIQKLPESFLEEKLAALLKINTRESIQKCIELVVSRQVDFNVALHFCEEAYDKNDEDRCNVYNDLFFRVRQTYTNDNNMLIKCISELLNQKAEFLNPLNIVENIPKDIPIQDLRNFFLYSTVPRINNIRGLRLKNALLEATVREKEKHINLLKSGKVVVSKSLKCIVCGKPINDAVFYVLKDSTVAHAACKPSTD